MDIDQIPLERRLLFIACWIFGAVIMLRSVPYLSPEQSFETNIVPLILSASGLFLFFLPFFKSIKIPQLLELEQNIQETKEELMSFKQQITTSIASLSANISTINHNSNVTNVNVSTSELKKESARIDRKLAKNVRQYLGEVTNELVLEDEDTVLSLARIRILLESQLRRILGKTQDTVDSSRQIKFLSLSSLVNLFVKEYEKYSYMQNSFRYVIQICNAAIHGQQVNSAQASEVINLGTKLIAELRNIET